jgi:pimeloyl-ACP methyl ester carboxylesterase
MELETRYTITGDGLHIAYMVIGDGLVDLILPEVFTLSLEYVGIVPGMAPFLERLGSFARVIVFDPRDTGLSDREGGGQLPTLESRMADVTAVMAAVGSDRAAFLGWDDGGPLCTVFAATYPERTMALVLYATGAAGLNRDEYTIAWSREQWDDFIADIDKRWGSQSHADEHLRFVWPSAADDPDVRRAWASMLRVGASPGTAVMRHRMLRDTDVRHVLPAIHVPTLVLSLEHGPVYSIDECRYMADHIGGARFAIIPGSDHVPWGDGGDALAQEVERFLGAVRNEESELDRVLATVLFTDIVGSTEKMVELGNQGWKALVEHHHALVRSLILRYRGSEVDTAGDGFFATFDGPARAIRCGQAVTTAAHALGLNVRVGLHTGECELINGKVGGIAVVIGSRVAALARAHEVLVTHTVKDLVAGSGLAFEDIGEHNLTGVPDEWRLYRVAD